MFASAAFYPQQGGEEKWVVGLRVHGANKAENKQWCKHGSPFDTHITEIGEESEGRSEFVDSK